MLNSTTILRLAACLAILVLATAVLSAGEKKLMHCFTFTPVETATEGDWNAFYKATDELPGKIPGLLKVWHGKLTRELAIFGTDRETFKKLAAGEKDVTGPVTRRMRTYGVCMELADDAALKVYAGHPAHKEWNDVYAKVRQSPTTTIDIVGR